MTRTEAADPVFFRVAGPALRTSELESRSRREGRIARHIRGTRCATVPAAYDEFAAACQFPACFGANGDAFIESLTDVARGAGEPGSNPRGLDLVILDADRFLPGDAADDSGDLEFLVRLLGYAAEELREPAGTAVGAPATARELRVFLHFGATSGRRGPGRWRAAGAGALPVVEPA